MKILFVSLGCDKNSVDSEVMLGHLVDSGYEFTDDENEADIAIVNSCCFINDAKEESINTIISLGELKESGKLKALILTGCLGQRYSDEIHTELPEVDAIVGISSIDSIADVVKSVIEGQPQDAIGPLNAPIRGNKHRVMTTGGYSEYIKIAEGCDKHCTYCVIPKIRGPYRSIPMEDVVEEARTLAQSGVKELILVAQETTLYGMDLYGKKMLPELLHRLSQIEELAIIRILYLYPEEITDELIECIASEPKIANYVDIPIQSGSDRILKLMGRRTSRSEIYELVGKLRERIPDICIRTTLIAGFPGEGNEDFEDSLKMVEDLKFDRLGVFTYSQEDNTPAARMDNQIEDDVKIDRMNEIMLCQQGIALKTNRTLIGRKMKVIIDGMIPEEKIYVGRTYRDIPDVDGCVFVNSPKELMSGDMVEVLITEAGEYDLVGDVV